MKRTEEMLRRLLQSAARAPQGAAAEVPFGFDTRVLAQRRNHLSNPDRLELAEYFRWALVLACLVMGAIILFNYSDLGHNRNDELAILNSTINLALNP